MDTINVVLCAAGHNIRLLAKWFRHLLLKILAFCIAKIETYTQNQTQHAA